MDRLLAALAVCSWIASADRQDPAPDRTELPARVESWYRVVQDSRTVGAAHERLERVYGLPWRYTYLFRSEMAFDAPDPRSPRRSVTRSEDVRVEALLDDALAPVYLEQTVWVDEARSRWTLAAGTLRAELSGTELRTAAAEADAQGSPSLALFALRQAGTLAKEGRFQIRLLDPRRTDVSFDSGALQNHETRGGARPATRITFLKPPAAGHAETAWKEAWIDKYGRVLDATLWNGTRLLLVEGPEGAELPDRVWRAGRRDPWDKAEAMRRSSRPEEIPVENPVPTVTADTFRSVLADADRLLRRMAEARDAGLPDELRETYFLFLAHWKALRAQAALPQRPDLDARRSEAERLYDGAARASAEAARMYAAAVDQFERRECAALERELGRLRRLRDRIELEYRPELLEVLTWTARAEPLLRRCRDREELEEKRLDLEATVVYEEIVTRTLDLWGMPQEIRITKPLSMAVVNGVIYRPGDLIPREGVRVEQITRQAILVSLRQELRWIPWKSPRDR